MKLAPSQRNYFSLVQDGAFVNPFSPERLAIYQQLADQPENRNWLELVDRLRARLKSQLAELEAKKPLRLTDFTGPDRELMQNVYLFHIYNQLFEQFDHWIDRQSRRPEQTDPVPFASDALGMFIKRGFTQAEAARYFAIFYQLRRAFYFIDRGLIGCSDCMHQLRMHLWNNIFTHDVRIYDRYLQGKMEDFATLLLGPTGAGKGAAAAAIGRSGFIPLDPKTMQFRASFMQAFIPINLSQYPETLMESALFGHSKGAFTGALSNHDGLLARCSPYGSIFLDEIGDVSVPVQIKLLQVLEERVFSPLGTYKKQKFAGRVIAATNRSIDDLRCSGAFRDDFFYRLCSDVIHVPGLHRRIAEDPAELDEMVAHVVAWITGEPPVAAKRGEVGSEELTGLVLGTIRKDLGTSYPWPGNVRELAQCVRRILIKRSYEGDTAIQTDKKSDAWLNELQQGRLTAQEILSGYCRMLYSRHGNYEQVGRLTGLDRRTVKKYVDEGKS